MLQRFADAGVHATWATVGLLFNRDATELDRNQPAITPSYDDPRFSPYHYASWPALANEYSAPGLFAPSLIQQIARTPGQEIGSHTYSHYFCLEPGQSLAEFEADLRQAVAIAARRDITLRSLVFPRNQYTADHVEVARKVGFTVVRCQQTHWLYQPRNRSGEGRVLRLLRLLDSYLPLSGSNVVDPATIEHGAMVCLPASRFLRPFSPHLSLFDALRLRRIKRSMTHAARTGGIFHLWWHPHNFGAQSEQNLLQLQQILDHYRTLQERYGFISLNMSEIADRIEVDRRGPVHGTVAGPVQAPLPLAS